MEPFSATTTYHAFIKSAAGIRTADKDLKELDPALAALLDTPPKNSFSSASSSNNNWSSESVAATTNASSSKEAASSYFHSSPPRSKKGGVGLMSSSPSAPFKATGGAGNDVTSSKHPQCNSSFSHHNPRLNTFAAWLGDAFYQQYGLFFKRHGFDNVEVLRSLSDQQVDYLFRECLPKDLPAGHRFLILNKIDELKKLSRRGLASGAEIAGKESQHHGGGRAKSPAASTTTTAAATATTAAATQVTSTPTGSNKPHVLQRGSVAAVAPVTPSTTVVAHAVANTYRASTPPATSAAATAARAAARSGGANSSGTATISQTQTATTFVSAAATPRVVVTPNRAVTPTLAKHHRGLSPPVAPAAANAGAAVAAVAFTRQQPLTKEQQLRKQQQLQRGGKERPKWIGSKGQSAAQLARHVPGSPSAAIISPPRPFALNHHNANNSGNNTGNASRANSPSAIAPLLYHHYPHLHQQPIYHAAQHQQSHQQQLLLQVTALVSPAARLAHALDISRNKKIEAMQQQQMAEIVSGNNNNNNNNNTSNSFTTNTRGTPTIGPASIAPYQAHPSHSQPVHYTQPLTRHAARPHATNSSLGGSSGGLSPHHHHHHHHGQRAVPTTRIDFASKHTPLASSVLSPAGGLVSTLDTIISAPGSFESLLANLHHPPGVMMMISPSRPVPRY